MGDVLSAVYDIFTISHKLVVTLYHDILIFKYILLYLFVFVKSPEQQGKS